MLHATPRKSWINKDSKAVPKGFEFFFKQKDFRPQDNSLYRLSFEEYYNLLVNHIPVHAIRLSRNYQQVDLERRKRLLTDSYVRYDSVSSVIKSRRAVLYARDYSSKRMLSESTECSRNSRRTMRFLT